MGTYEASKYVTARQTYRCDHSDTTIVKGARYLRYQVGLKSSERVCMNCSVGLNSRGTLRFPCRAVEAEKERQSRAAVTSTPSQT